jgi:hypothetical protein
VNWQSYPRKQWSWASSWTDDFSLEVIEVNPAYTSVIGTVNHAQRNGVSVHQGAALAVARRGKCLSKKPPKRGVLVPTRNGCHVTFCVPAKRAASMYGHTGEDQNNPESGICSGWSVGRSKRKPAPLSPEMRAFGAIGPSTVQFLSANRQHRCSASVNFQKVPC